MQKESSKIYEKACVVMPGGVSSPVRSFRHLQREPLIAAYGKGSKLYDVDGKSYIDYCCSWGSLLLGHAPFSVLEAIEKQLRKGSSFGLTTQVEVELAEKIISHFPSIEKLRFVNSGTEATMTALRLARGFTARSKIVKFTGHYHGHSDALLVQAGSGVSELNSVATSQGVTPATLLDTICLPFNDEKALSTLFSLHKGDIAAVIVEPIAANMGVVPPNDRFLEILREKTKEAGALLIFDEIVTGYRVGLQGVQGIKNIDPDLTCLGKIIGAGFPVAAIGGKKEIIDTLAPLGGVYQAGTLSGNPVSMSAAIQVLSEIERPFFYEVLEKKMERLIQPISEALLSKKRPATLQSAGSMFTLFFGVEKVTKKEDLQTLDRSLFSQLFSFLLERGIYFSPSAEEACFISTAHLDEEIDYTVDCILDFLKRYW